MYCACKVVITKKYYKLVGEVLGMKLGVGAYDRWWQQKPKI